MTLLSFIAEQSVEALAALTSSELEQQQAELNRIDQHLTACKTQLSAAIHQKYAERLSLLRQQLTQESDDVHFNDDGIAIKATIDNEVQWDQTMLADIAHRIRQHGTDPEEFISLTYDIPECIYSRWPKHLRSLFSCARTLRAKKQTIVLSIEKGGDQ